MRDGDVEKMQDPVLYNGYHENGSFDGRKSIALAKCITGTFHFLAIVLANTRNKS